MDSVTRKLLLAVFLLLAPVVKATPPPTLFFTDITSGPGTGGESISGFAGSYVTLFGNNFGPTQGTSTVTLNGAACLRVVSWGTAWLWYQYVTVQLGPSCTTGNFVITTSAGTSNTLPFTVRAGHIYFVMPTGNNNNPGTATSPFATVNFCTDKTEVAGDICYVKNVNALGLYNFGSVDLTNSGTLANPIALVAYPGTFGNSQLGDDTVNKGVCWCFGSNWTVAGFHMRSNTIAGYVKTSFNRVIANFIECPAVTFGTSEGCLEPFAGVTNIVAFGNESTNVGNGGKQYHAFYFGADGHDYEIGWNKIHDIQGCRAFQTFHGSMNTFNISIHDNLIYNIPCDGINIASVSADQGFVKVYNNVIHHAGAGPDLGGQNATCINIASTGGTVVANAQVYNNTMYDCGALGNSDSAITSAQINTSFHNNIYNAIGTEPYTTSTAGFTQTSGSNNLYNGHGNGPAQTTANVNANPLFTNTATCSANPPTSCDLTLQLTSLAKTGGVASWAGGVAPTYDINGLLRGPSPAIGAYEFSTASTLAPPTNLKATPLNIAAMLLFP